MSFARATGLLGVIAVTAVAIGWLIAGRVLRPLRTITAAARRISASSLDERLTLQGPDDELKELADTLDTPVNPRVLTGPFLRFIFHRGHPVST